jgi:hypothetical protein
MKNTKPEQQAKTKSNQQRNNRGNNTHRTWSAIHRHTSTRPNPTKSPMEAIKRTPLPFIKKARSFGHSTDKPFPWQELNLINHLFYVCFFITKNTVVLILPHHRRYLLLKTPSFPNIWEHKFLQRLYKSSRYFFVRFEDGGGKHDEYLGKI